MSQPRKQNFLYGAAILTGATIVIKILGFIYKIPLYNILGDAGTTHFSVAYNIYNVLLTLSTAGLPVALSKMIASADALGRPLQIKRTFSVARAAFFILGILSTLGMFIFNEQLAEFMNDTDAAASIKALAPSVVLCCLMSAYRGYAQGHSDMVPTSVSQILEVLVKLIFGLGLAYLFVKSNQSSGTVSAGAIIGVSIGSAVALLYLIWHKKFKSKDYASPTASPDIPSSRSEILKELLKIAIPIAVASSVFSVINLIDSQQVLGRLQSAAGFTKDQADVLNGVYYKGVTLYSLATSFINPLTISIIPAISACMAKRQEKHASSLAESAMRISNLIAFPAGIGLCVLAHPIFNALYPNSSPEGPALLASLGIASIFVCISLITTSILQAYGYARLSLYNTCIGGVLKIVCNYILVGIPSINIHGAPVGTFVCYGVISLLNILVIRTKLSEPPKVFRSFIRPAIASIIMGIVAYFSYDILSHIMGGDAISRIGMIVSLAIAIILAVIVYFILIIVIKGITRDDVLLLPKGEKIAKLLRLK